MGETINGMPIAWFDKESQENTPARWQKFLEEWFKKRLAFNFTTFKNEGYDEIVLVKDISFYSLCTHHLLPFHGVAHVAYIPDKKICGLSKLARTVDLFASTPQLQERMTMQIARKIQDKLQPKGVAVIIEAEHLCMSMRGVQKPGSKTVTSCMKGVFRTKAEARSELLQLIKR